MDLVGGQSFDQQSVGGRAQSGLSVVGGLGFAGGVACGVSARGWAVCVLGLVWWGCMTVRGDSGLGGDPRVIMGSASEQHGRGVSGLSHVDTE
jgi:hypothetical protein